MEKTNPELKVPSAPDKLPVNAVLDPLKQGSVARKPAQAEPKPKENKETAQGN